jgi:hypothetical protein
MSMNDVNQEYKEKRFIEEVSFVWNWMYWCCLGERTLPVLGATVNKGKHF